MIGRSALALLLAAAAPAWAEGGPIRGGEHVGFSRVVMMIEPTTEWSLETADRVATIRFPGRRLDFDPAEVFARMPNTRVRAVRSGSDASGTIVEVELGCACRVSASFVGARHLALDISDRGVAAEPPSPAEAAAPRKDSEEKAVSAAERLLIAQIERAAGQGLVLLSENEPAAPPPRPARVTPVDPRTEQLPATERIGLKPPARGQRSGAAKAAPLELSGLEHDQIDATTVFDRDSRRVRERTTETVADACLPDSAVDVGGWSNGMPLTDQLASLRRQLVGEFDASDPKAVRDLARLYIRFGFGAEAETLLTSFGGADVVPEAPLLIDLARVLDGAPARAGGPLSYPGSCPGAFSLWLALGGRAPVYGGPASFAEVQAAFEALPVELRLWLGPAYVGRLLDAGRAAEARLIYDTTVRSGATPDAPTRLAAARLMAAEGRIPEAAQALVRLAEAENETATPALAALVELALAGGLPLPQRVMTDLRAAVLLHRGAEREAELRALLAAALASRAELPEAVSEARAAMAAVPDAADAFAALAVRSIAEADPARVGAAAYAETALGAVDLVARTPARDPWRRAIARQLVRLGLPDPALAMIAPALVVDDPAARLIAAAVELRRGAPDAAEAILGSLQGADAAGLRAAAYARNGQYDRALAADGTDAYAWPSGAWERALAAADDPSRAALAGYMAGRPSDGAEAPLPPEAAFRAPVPNLSRPSLGAARQLLSAGPQIGGFVEGLLEADTSAAP